jgi:ketosteroid isomerase-like protein
MTYDDVQRWLDDYANAWRSYDAEEIGELFSQDAEYRYQPWSEPLAGRDAIVADWLENRDEPGTYEGRYSPFAVDGDRAVAIGESRYSNPDGSFRTLFYNVWALRFDADGRCRSFIEYFMELPAGRQP